ncbi:RNA polymerase sigma factor [Microlunatus soli]|uniref:RNA polymerase sigma-70 factor, ECF subfamily n=1 Tax=Microlunatus soli TaxID=630515 RepID=A0A1H1URG2_9ACTN|nr:RNA polymerase sigma factor [Microlunatus soli]SDS75093.1 RNA polymerase sigma-70 factor, ECF subfamily [Microlunatus soli]
MADVFAEHVDTIYNYCYRRAGSWETAEDLTSQVFLTAWHQHHRVIANDAGSVLPWLYGVATNVCRNHQRSRRRHLAALPRLAAVERVTSGDPPALDDQVIDRLSRQGRLRRALDRLASLSTADQEAFVLVCWEELSYADAAAALGIRIGTVKSRVARVRRALRSADHSAAPRAGLAGAE